MALGFQLYAPVLVPLLVVLAVACGVATPYASTDLLMTVEAVPGRSLGRGGVGGGDLRFQLPRWGLLC